jgi:hypothetical protein
LYLLLVFFNFHGIEIFYSELPALHYLEIPFLSHKNFFTHVSLKKHYFWEGWGQGGEMNQALYAHMNNKRKKMCIMQEIKKKLFFGSTGV